MVRRLCQLDNLLHSSCGYKHRIKKRVKSDPNIFARRLLGGKGNINIGLSIWGYIGIIRNPTHGKCGILRA